MSGDPCQAGSRGREESRGLCPRKAGSWEGPREGTYTIMAVGRGSRASTGLWEGRRSEFWTLKKGEVLLNPTQLPTSIPEAPSPFPPPPRNTPGRTGEQVTCEPLYLVTDTVSTPPLWRSVWTRSQRTDSRPAKGDSVTLDSSVSLSEPQFPRLCNGDSSSPP